MQEEISFGVWLRKQRRVLDLTRQALAHQIGCAEVTLRRIEAGTLKPSKALVSIILEKLAIPESERSQWISFARGVSGFPSHSPTSSNKPKSNLPAQLTTFIGREKEQLDVIRLITKHRLVTLTGSGGVGKTRLSIKVAEQISRDFSDGVWLVELAPILDPVLVPRTTAIAIGLRDEPQRPVIDMLSDYLREKKLLLILDNCEHLVDACARLADTLLKHCPSLKILATSREVLGVLGEASYHVPSLEVPDRQQIVEKLRDYASVRLFEERAQLTQVEFSLTLENVSSVAKICKQLDGIPLAIELAAARISTFSTEQIAARLQKSLDLLTTGNRTALPRHQTLQATIDWSYDLLSPAEQTLFRRLSVFVDGWTLDAATSVCSNDNNKSKTIVASLTRLIHKSLVIRQETQVGVRYHMLETLRQYANEKLVRSGESDMLHDSHLQYFLNLAETAEPHLVGPEQLEWLPLLDAEYQNLRLALEWALSKESAESSLRLGAALGMFWIIRDHWQEGSKWLASALAKPVGHENNIEKAARVKALHLDAELSQLLDDVQRMKNSAELALKLTQQGLERRDNAIGSFYMGASLFRLGELDQSRAYLEQSLKKFQKLTEPYWEANACFLLSVIYLWHGDPKSILFARRSIELTRKAGELLSLLNALSNCASLLLFMYEQTDESRKLLQEAEALLKQAGSNISSLAFVRVQVNFAQVEWLDENRQQAKDLFVESQARLRLLGERELSSSCIESLGLLSMEEGDLEHAQIYLEEALTIAQELEAKLLIARRLGILSILFHLQGNIEKSKQEFKKSFSLIKACPPHGKAWFLASLFISPHFHVEKNSALLLGAIRSFEREIQHFINPFSNRYCNRAEAHARKALGNAVFDTLFADGQNMSLDNALDLALRMVEET